MSEPAGASNGFAALVLDVMQKRIQILGTGLLFALLTSCVQVDYKAESLEPDHKVWTEGEFELFFKVKSQEKERNFTNSAHKTRIEFPPNFAFVFSAPHQQKGSVVTISALSIKHSSGHTIYELKEEKELLLGMDSLEAYEHFGGFRMYGFKQGEPSPANAIYTTGWLQGFEVGEEYSLSVSYVLPNNQKFDRSIVSVMRGAVVISYSLSS